MAGELAGFLNSSQGGQLSYAYCAALQSLLANMETVKRVYLACSDSARTKEVSRAVFTRAAQTMSQVTPLEIGRQEQSNSNRMCGPCFHSSSLAFSTGLI